MTATVTAEAGVELLHAVGLQTAVKSSSRLDLVGTTDSGEKFMVEVKTRQTPPTPTDIHRDLRVFLSHPPESQAILLYIVSHLTPSLREAARANSCLAVASIRDSSVIIRSKEYRVDEISPDRYRSTIRRSRKPAWGRYALMRSLLRTSTPRRQIVLAEESGVSQAAISHILNANRDETIRQGAGWIAADPAKLIDTFLKSYPGPLGIATNWFGLESVREQARRVGAAAPSNLELLVSGDVAADQIAPWRRPIKAVLYAKAGLSHADGRSQLPQHGFAESKASQATLEFVVPADATIWATARAWGSSTDRGPTVDPLIAAWDVGRTGGSDASEAVSKLREFVLDHWKAGSDPLHR
jgi:hypothetical protein